MNLRSKNVLDNEDQQATAVEVFNEISEILNGLEDGDTLELRGIGVFKAKFQPGRVYNNINTGKKEMSSGKTVIKFHRIKRGEFMSPEDKAEIDASDQIPQPETKQLQPHKTKPVETTDDEQKVIVKITDINEMKEFIARKVKIGYQWSTYEYEDYIDIKLMHLARLQYDIELAKQDD